MIVIRIELHSAITKKATTLHTIIVDTVKAHEGGKRFDYRARVWKRGVELLDLQMNPTMLSKPLREGLVEEHSRDSYPVPNLLWKALTAMGYGK